MITKPQFMSLGNMFGGLYFEGVVDAGDMDGFDGVMVYHVD